MNVNFYDSGRSYYTPINKEKSNNEAETVASKVSKSTEGFKNLVNLISSKSINRITTTESEQLITSLRSRITGQKGDPERSAIDKAIRKIREREEMALSRSVLPSAKQRHTENIQFIETVMYANNIEGTTSKAFLQERLEKFNKLCSLIKNKSLNQIKASEVDLFISLGFEIKGLLSDLNLPEKEWAEKNISEEINQNQRVAFSKVLEREIMALDESTLESSKNRHQKNINILKSVPKI